jgi:hypothetical protein
MTKTEHPPRLDRARLNDAQRKTMAEYSGTVVSATVKTGEYSDESPATGYAFKVRYSTGWIVLIGRYGAVLDESHENLCQCGLAHLGPVKAEQWTPGNAGHLAYCPAA